VAHRSDQPASLARRFGAVLIDGIVIALMGGLAWLAIPGRQELDIAVTSTMYALIGAVYEVILVARFGQTAGKAIVGIAVVNISCDHPTVGQSALRYVVKSLQPLGVLARWLGTPSRLASAFVGTGWDLVLLSSIASNGQGQGLHDRLARTAVVNVARREPSSVRVSGRSAPVELTFVERGKVRKRRIRARR
jgi:uncharacterized RDD family membrane protein YckC